MRETQRRLTPREERRKARLEELSREMAERGYVRRDLLVSALQVNVLGSLIMLPFAVLLGWSFFAVNPLGRVEFRLFGYLSFLLALLVLVTVHELIHGAVWAAFVKDHFQAIEFGVMWQYLMPYCTCKEPLRKGQYLLGTAMPTLLLGGALGVLSVVLGSLWLFLLAEAMVFGGGGDALLIVKLLRCTAKGRETVYLDHPYECGLILWEKP